MRARLIKKLSDEAIIKIVVASEKAIADSQERLAPVVGGIVDCDWLEVGVKAGFYKMREVHLDGVPMYRYFFHLDDQKFVHINASLFIGPTGTGNPALWGVGADRIAQEFFAKGIVCCTNRLGHIRQAEGWGYKILGVLMAKEL